MGFRDARQSSRMTLREIADYLQLSISTVKRYDTLDSAPKAVIECLRLLSGQFPDFARRKGSFDSWSIGQGYLWSPGGERFTSGDVLASRINQELVDALYRSNCRLRQEMKAFNKPAVNVIDFTFERKKRGIIP